MSQAIQQNQTPNNAGAPPGGEPNSSAVDWQKLCQELTAERDQLRAELARTREDRDDYLRAVKALLPEREYTFTKEELFAQVCREPSFEELIAELERDAGE